MLTTTALVASAIGLSPPASAQGACHPDTEPNDTPEAASLVVGPPGCFDGALSAGDQDLVLWEVPPGSVAVPWEFDLGGVTGTLTTLQLFRVTSAPGSEPIVADRGAILQLDAAPDGDGTAHHEAVLLPAGRYLLGITRSGIPGGGEPTETSYRYAIEAGESAQSTELEPNDDAESATRVSNEFSMGGDLDGSRDTYVWTVEPSEDRWVMDLQVPIGETGSWQLSTPDGTPVTDASGNTGIRGWDLALPAGDYIITVSPQSNGPRPYRLRAERIAAEWDAEPNADGATAVPVSDGQLTHGRLAGDGDRDRFVLDVPGGERYLRTVRMLWDGDEERQLCLLTAEGSDIVCRRGTGGVSLADLGLEAGRHFLEVRGPEDPQLPYAMRIDTTSAVAPDFEAEPNEDIATATALDPTLGMRARGGPEDRDVFRLELDGQPQLWQIDVEGAEISRAELVRPRGTSLATADVAADRSTARLSDLYLVPGEHWLRVVAGGPEYRIEATPLGPPDPDAELEPNDDVTVAQPYRVGTRRVGRLPTGSDRDLYRFTLPAAQHIRLDLAQPADAATTMRIERDGNELTELARLPVGEPISVELWLEAGDHVVELTPEQPSDGTYELASANLNPFAPGADREPNDGPAWARPVPPSLSWSGSAADPDDVDWYRLPPATAELPIEVNVQGDATVRLMVLDGSGATGRQVGLAPADDGTLRSTEAIPLDVPMLLAVTARSAYQIRLDGAGLVAEEPAVDAAIELAWRLPVDEVAAYWPEAQVIDAELELQNTGPDVTDATLEVRTSHHQWRAEPSATTVSIPAGERTVIPISVVVGADAWGTEPVLVSAQATTSSGARVSATATLTSSGDALPVHPRPGWSVPTELLGGLDVAAVALGGEPGGTIDPDQERRLFDGATPEGPVAQADQVYRNGFSVFVSDHVERLPLELTVDLAGEEPIPIVGTILNPQASQGELEQTPRDFQLLLSDDGTTWQSVLRATLSPQRIDQAFVLDEPVPATHAMLRIWSKYVDQGAYLSLGEWKVVAAPGHGLDDQPLDVADPTLGGHLVTSDPFIDDPEVRGAILDADTKKQTLELGDPRNLEMIVGLQDGRAAQVTSLAWVDPVSSDPDERLDRIDVLTSLRGAAGPWRLLGSWDLTRGAAGDVSPFEFDHPEWVRYLRLSAHLTGEPTEVELPGQLRMFERPTDDDYRSIVGEWGYRESNGPYEWSDPGEPVMFDPAIDAGDTPTDASPLAADTVVADRVEIDVDEDWYTIEVPPDHDSLELLVDGRPLVGVALTLVDEAGSQREMAFRTDPDGRVRYRASVEPGSYQLQVRQPPFSAVFAFDTSPSIDPFLDMVVQGMRSFLGDVQPGREVVTLLPFEEAPLVPDWEDDPWVLQNAFENHVVMGPGSSGAEAALIDASSRLLEREGARAILLITDAETTTSELTPQLWEGLAQARPAIFGVHIGALLEPVASRQRMQDWATAGGGHYSYPTTNGEMDRAFERMATWLRRPAAYTLAYSTINVVPGTIAVRPPIEGAGATAAVALAPGTGVAIILDTSGSMRERLGGKRRIQVAKDSLRSLLRDGLAEGVPVAIRTFGGPGKGKAARCETTLALPLAPLDREHALKTVASIAAKKKTSTPIAAALQAVPKDLQDVEGLKTVVLITDGAATCDGDVPTAIAALGEAGIDVRLDIVGLSLGDDEIKQQMDDWAAAGGGAYYDATGAAELATSLEAVLSAPFRVYGDDAEPLAVGTVGGEAVELDPGTYRVEVLIDPPVIYDDVELENGGNVVVELPPDDE